MKQSHLTWLILTTLLSACCTLECIAPVDRNIKPYGAHWIKEGMTKESRLDDTLACGSGRTEYVLFSDEKINTAKQSEDPNDIKGYLRLRDYWGQCMHNKGYVYLEHCDTRCQYP